MNVNRVGKLTSSGVECERCEYGAWKYEDTPRKAYDVLIRDGWRFGLQGQYEKYGWTCPVCSRELSGTDVEVMDEMLEVADG
jgi:hypothetical protein